MSSDEKLSLLRASVRRLRQAVHVGVPHEDLGFDLSAVEALVAHLRPDDFSDPEMQILEFTSLLSRRYTGIVDLRVNGVLISQWDVRKAKAIRDMLGEAIEAAISDEIVFRFLRECVHLSESEAASALYKLRELRQGTPHAVDPS